MSIEKSNEIEAFMIEQTYYLYTDDRKIDGN